MRRLRRDRDSGFTLIELVLTVVIMGVILLPLGNFLLEYFVKQTSVQNRLSESHDVQIATAYFSKDVANIGLRAATGTSTAGYAAQQSVWTASVPPSGSYCGSTSGTLVALFRYDDWSTSGGGGSNNVQSIAYVLSSGTLLRIYCASTSTTPSSTTTSQATLVHNVDSSSLPTITCSATANGAFTAGACTPTPPSFVKLALSLKAQGDSSATTATLTGQRRQS